MIKEYKSPKHCSKWTELKFILYDGGWGDSGAFMFYQCKNCGVIIKERINDAKEEENN